MPVPKPTTELPNVLVVCHGNICRSPLCATVLARALGSTRVRSRGFSRKINRKAAKKVRDYAAQTGYSLEHHRSQGVSASDIQWADLIVYMDGGQLKRLAEFGSGTLEKCRCLGSWCSPPISRIPDPNFMPRGEELNNLLLTIVNASLEIVRWL